MTTFAESIVRVRRLIRDESSRTIDTDTPIRKLLGRNQQKFARETSCLVLVKELVAPPEIELCHTHSWEEGAYPSYSYSYFSPFVCDGTYSATKPFEISNDFDLAGREYLITCGDDASHIEPGHEVPLVVGPDYYKPRGLLWNYRNVEQRGYHIVDEFYDDGWAHQGTEVDFFCHGEGLHRKVLLVRALPYAKPDDRYTVAQRDSMVDEELRENVFILIYVGIPNTPDDTSEEFGINEPFVKYVEYLTAARLLRTYYQIRDLERAAHFEFRYALGVKLVSNLISKLNARASRQLGGENFRAGRKPPYPRLPDHYPRLRLR